MPIRITVADHQQADAVWQLLQHADDDLFPVELWLAGELWWTASRTPAGLLTTLQTAPQGHSCPASDPAAP
jgi:hypothetical protein